MVTDQLDERKVTDENHIPHTSYPDSLKVVMCQKILNEEGWTINRVCNGLKVSYSSVKLWLDNYEKSEGKTCTGGRRGPKYGVRRSYSMELKKSFAGRPKATKLEIYR